MTSPGGKALSRLSAVPAGELEQSVRETLEELQLQPEDAGIRALVLRYARALDDGGDLIDLGPKLLAALDALGATPKARAMAGKPAPAGAGSKLSAMRRGA